MNLARQLHCDVASGQSTRGEGHEAGTCGPLAGPRNWLRKLNKGAWSGWLRSDGGYSSACAACATRAERGLGVSARGQNGRRSNPRQGPQKATISRNSPPPQTATEPTPISAHARPAYMHVQGPAHLAGTLGRHAWTGGLHTVGGVQLEKRKKDKKLCIRTLGKVRDRLALSLIHI